MPSCVSCYDSLQQSLEPRGSAEESTQNPALPRLAPACQVGHAGRRLVGPIRYCPRAQFAKLRLKAENDTKAQMVMNRFETAP